MPKRKSDELTPKELLFVSGIVQGLSKAQAYVTAGYSPNNAESNGLRLSKKERIKNAIEAAMRRVTGDRDNDTKRLYAEVMKAAFQRGDEIVDRTGDDWELKPPNQLSDDAWATIASVEISPTKFGKKVKITRQSKEAAQEHMAKILGMVKNTLDLESGGKPIRPAFILVPDDNSQCNPIDESSKATG
jgi:phage terminase small subunit